MSLALSIIFTAVVVAITIAAIAGLWKSFEKAGEKGWKAIIPIYNFYILIRISGHSGWWLSLLLLPILIILLGATVVGNFESVVTNSGPGQIGLTGVASFLVNLFSVAVQMTVIVASVVTYDVARSFGKGLGFTVGLAVLPFIFWPILGFGKSEYRGRVAHPKMIAEGSGAHLPVEVNEDDSPVEEENSDVEDKEENDDEGEVQSSIDSEK